MISLYDHLIMDNLSNRIFNNIKLIFSFRSMDESIKCNWIFLLVFHIIHLEGLKKKWINNGEKYGEGGGGDNTIFLL